MEVSGRTAGLLDERAVLGEFCGVVTKERGLGGDGEDAAPEPEEDAIVVADEAVENDPLEEATERRWTTLFTVTRVIPLEEGRICRVALGGFGRTL